MTIRPFVRSATISGGGIALIAALLIISGCSESTTSPASQALSDALDGGASIQSVDTDFANVQWTVEERVGNAGGTMLLDGQDLKLTFAPKVLPGTKTITARMRLNGARGVATRLDLDIEPAMTYRYYPVQLSVSTSYLAGTTGTYKLVSFDQLNSRWQVLEEKKIGTSSTVVFNITDSSIHYSVTR